MDVDVGKNMLGVGAKDMFVRFQLGCSVSQGADVAAVVLRELEGIAYAIFFCLCETGCWKVLSLDFCARGNVFFSYSTVADVVW